MTGDYSVSLWIKLEQLPSTVGSGMYLINKTFGGDGGGYRMFLSSDNKLRAYFWDSGGSPDTTDYTTGVAVDSNDVGVWVHFVVTVDISSSTGTKVYKDNVSQIMTYDENRTTSVGDSTAYIEPFNEQIEKSQKVRPGPVDL